jgi:glycosyltransferase involved in cell wall biosynthesis
MVRERIIFLSTKNPFSTRDWSGIPFFMMQALQKEYEVEYLPAPSFEFLRRAGYYVGKLIHLLTERKYIFDYGIILALCYGRHYSGLLKRKVGYKFIFVPAGLSEIAFLNTKIPIVSFGDCSILQLINYYPSLNNVSRISSREVNFVEHRAFNKITLAFFSSSWASDFVKQHFKVNSVSTISFGCNLKQMTEIYPKQLSAKKCNLLFVGVDWERKGGDVALKILQDLVEKKIDARLTVIGCVPPPGNDLNHVRVIEKLDKDSAEGEREFVAILNRTDFFILPTRADCTPIVIAEAFSAGVPVLATNTGGIPSLVSEGVNGFMFAQDDVQGYVQRIIQLLNDSLQYNMISQNCIESYSTTFNWQRWAEEFKRITATHLN